MSVKNFESDRIASSGKRGFTLIELLVVIAIIVIIAAILLPVFARVRENARKSACQSNLHQIGLAVTQYLQDFDEHYCMSNLAYSSAAYSTDAGRWYNVIQPYVQSIQVFACPSSGPVLADCSYGWNISGTWHSGLNGSGFGYIPTDPYTPSGVIGVPLAVVQQPAQTILVMDPLSNGYGGNGLDAIGYSTEDYMPVLHGGQPYNPTGTAAAVAATGYAGGGNFLFADGHVKFDQAARAWGSSQWNIDKTITTNVTQP